MRTTLLLVALGATVAFKCPNLINSSWFQLFLNLTGGQ